MTTPPKTSREGFVSILLLISVLIGLLAASVATLFAIKYIEDLPENPSKPPRERVHAPDPEEPMSELFSVPEKPEPPAALGTFTDDRAPAPYTYKTAKIGGKTWFAENLRYPSKDSWCYGDDSANCGKYGRLYVWNAAKTVCPTGWRLPSRQEWLALLEASGGEESAGKRLKSKTGWDEGGGGTDSRGFSALPGGNRHHTAGDFSYVGSTGFWWTATEYGGGSVYIRTMSYGDDEASESYTAKDGGLSVRCVKDD